VRPADTTPPTLTISSPLGTIVWTTNRTIKITGTARDNIGVVEVRWTTSTGVSGLATGTAAWSTGDVPLLVGDNMVTIRAKDAAGNVGWRSITVVRR